MKTEMGPRDRTISRLGWSKFFSRLRGRANKVGSTHHFIHIPKNGGMAIREYLQRRGGVGLTDPFHYRYRDLDPETLKGKLAFCLIRNPWSRTASRYHYAKQQALKWDTSDPRRQYIESIDFAAFVRDRKVVNGIKFPGKPWMGPTFAWENQIEWIVDEASIVSGVCLRFEHMDKDLSELLGENVKIEPKNVTRSTSDYKSLYTEELADLVRQHHKRDIDYFGFTFDGAATRNVLSA